MQYTDEQFAGAMRSAVERAGGGFQYPRLRMPHETSRFYDGGSPTYQDGHGNGTCLIGCAIQELGAHLPDRFDKRGANAVLKNFGLSGAALIAARAAQMHQDYSRPWAEALTVFERAYAIVRDIYPSADGRDAYLVGTVYNQACSVSGFPRAMGRSTLGTFDLGSSAAMQKQMQELTYVVTKFAEATKTIAATVETSLVSSGFASGGVIDTSAYGSATTGSIFGSMSEYPSVFFTEATISSSKTIVSSKQKDHALVA